MNKTKKWLCFALVLCMLCGLLPFAFADSDEAAEAEEKAKQEADDLSDPYRKSASSLPARRQ